MDLQLAQALSLPPSGGAVSLVGAGGKTSLLFRLARELAGGGAAVVVTTTTHIRMPDPQEADILLLTDGRPDTLLAALCSHPIICAAAPAPGGKLSRPPDALLDAALRAGVWLLAEADGARRCPVKAPAAWEPQILEPSRAVVAVAGLTALGRPLCEVCHRFELAASLLAVPPDTTLTPLLLARLLTSARGQFKHVGDAARFRVFLNQADDERLTELGRQTAAHVLRLLPGCRVALGALEQEDCIRGGLPC